MPGSGAPAFARHAPRDAVLYDELEVHWGASARSVTCCVLVGWLRVVRRPAVDDAERIEICSFSRCVSGVGIV